MLCSIYVAGLSCSDFHLWYSSFEVTAHISSQMYSKCWGGLIAAGKGKAIEITIQKRNFFLNLIKKKRKRKENSLKFREQILWTKACCYSNSIPIAVDEETQYFKGRKFCYCSVRKGKNMLQSISCSFCWSYAQQDTWKIKFKKFILDLFPTCRRMVACDGGLSFCVREQQDIHTK